MYRNNQKEFLKAVLDCGDADLILLDGIGYDLVELVAELSRSRTQPTLKNIINAAFAKGIREMQLRLSDRIGELEHISKFASGGLNDEEKAELNELRSLNPSKDIQSAFDYQATSIWFARNKELYKKYFRRGIESIEYGTGFKFS